MLRCFDNSWASADCAAANAEKFRDMLAQFVGAARRGRLGGRVDLRHVPTVVLLFREPLENCLLYRISVERRPAGDRLVGIQGPLSACGAGQAYGA
jgi:hypothetical protein